MDMADEKYEGKEEKEAGAEQEGVEEWMEENEEEIVPKTNIFTICIHACSTFTMLEEHNIGFPLKKCIRINDPM